MTRLPLHRSPLRTTVIPIPPHKLELARRLIAHEKAHGGFSDGGSKSAQAAAKRKKSAAGKASDDLAADFSDNHAALDKLRPHLVTLMSQVGFQALLMRARALALRDAPWLSELTINPDGRIAGPANSVDATEAAAQGASRRRDPAYTAENVRAGSHFFLAHVLMLLEAFIGEKLTLHLVFDVWPEVPFDDLDSDRGEPFEKAN